MKTLRRIITAGILSTIPLFSYAEPEYFQKDIFSPYKQEFMMGELFEKTKPETENKLFGKAPEPLRRRSFSFKKLFIPSEAVTKKVMHFMDFYFIDDVPNIFAASSFNFLGHGGRFVPEPHTAHTALQEHISGLSKDYIVDDFVDRLKSDALRVRRVEFSPFENKKDFSVNKKEERNVSVDFKFEKEIFNENLSVRTHIFKTKAPFKWVKFNFTFDQDLEEKIDMLFYPPSLTKKEIQQLLGIEREMHELYYSEMLESSPTLNSWIFRSSFFKDTLSNSFGYKHGVFMGEVGFSVDKESNSSFFLNAGKPKNSLKLTYNNENDVGIEFSRKKGNNILYFSLNELPNSEVNAFLGIKMPLRKHY